jgi:hypothetical protein
MMLANEEAPRGGSLTPLRTRTSTVNPSVIRVLARSDFLGYPERYPRQ